MPNINLTIPVLQSEIKGYNGKNYWEVRPLFQQNPIGKHKNLQAAKNGFLTQVKRQFTDFTFSRDTANALLWYKFSPTLHFKQYDLEIRLKNRSWQLPFSVGHFQFADLDWLYLPAFNNHFSIIAPADTGSVNVAAQARLIIQKISRELQKTEEKDFDLPSYAAPKRQSVSTVNTSLFIEDAPFDFTDSQKSVLLLLNANAKQFKGGTEIRKAAICLNERVEVATDYSWYRDSEVAQVYNYLFEKKNAPLVLLGEVGTGRYSLVYQAVKNYLQHTEQSQKQSHLIEKVWLLDPTRVISGMSVVGQWEQRFEAIIKYVNQPEPHNPTVRYKLLIDKPVALLRIGRSSQSDMNLAKVMKLYLERQALQLILIATPGEWKIMQQHNRGFTDLFQVCRITEPNENTAVKMLLAFRRTLEGAGNNTYFESQALQELFTLHRNYLKNKPLPGALAKLMKQLTVKYPEKTVDAFLVRDEFEHLTGYRATIFDENYAFEKDEVYQGISQMLIGQVEAVTCMTNTVHLVKAKLRNPNKPLGSFLFVGPTGVGKTQAAKALTKYLTGSTKNLLRFDMNEYNTAGAADRLIGHYYHPEGQLTSKVKQRLFAVLLLDEIEKAHHSVRDILLQVLDDGRLTNSLGHTVDFSNTIIIMTSNVGARKVGSSLGFNQTNANRHAIYEQAIKDAFPPEFVNRIDEQVIFNSLTQRHIHRIAELQVHELLQRDGFVRRNTILNISPEALKHIARLGYNKNMGGRALKRQIEQDLTLLSAEQLLESTSKVPVIFDIFLDNEKLVPRITPLTFAQPMLSDWLPDIPTVEKGGVFFKALLERINTLKQRADDIYPQHDTDINYADNTAWPFYNFKDRILEIEGHLKKMLLGFRNKNFNIVLAAPFRLKSFRIGVSHWENKQNVYDKIFQKDALVELEEDYNITSAQFDSLETEFINNYLEVRLLELSFTGFAIGDIDQIEMSFESLIKGKGAPEISFLISQYQQLFNDLDYHSEVDENQGVIKLQGYYLYQLLTSEAGVHLFYKPHQNPLPVLCLVKLLNNYATNKPPNYHVIRVYHEKTMTDLRSGYTSLRDLTAHELKMLLLAGIEGANLQDELN